MSPGNLFYLMCTGSQHYRHLFNSPQRQGSIEQDKASMRNRTLANSQSYFSIQFVYGLSLANMPIFNMYYDFQVICKFQFKHIIKCLNKRDYDVISICLTLSRL